MRIMMFHLIWFWVFTLIGSGCSSYMDLGVHLTWIWVFILHESGCSPYLAPLKPDCCCDEGPCSVCPFLSHECHGHRVDCMALSLSISCTGSVISCLYCDRCVSVQGHLSSKQPKKLFTKYNFGTLSEAVHRYG